MTARKQREEEERLEEEERAEEGGRRKEPFKGTPLMAFQELGPAS